ncbi:glycosyl hydrolase catalytic core-domain-containing protein [Ampelomyces quisqualis]|uniref:Glycosyl hydrolase catalytic core-domain-containing protein n=1 Tax=Ampelomyces quisqualis TaxID=50730 RepID=A0A6A5QLI6_AMPQU|nr:glycosyl hydrolase catalytic core-domain-containing protein [Ampelomyces quisqualis]
MHRSALLAASATLTLAQPTSSPKRGLCHVTKNGNPTDDQIWLSGPSNPTWYYNYGSEPSSAYTSHPSLQFVPMLWGASPSDTGTPFYDSVKRQLESGAKISHVLAFNEPDATHAVGGSNVPINLAVSRWKAEIEPLKNLGIKVGGPGVTCAESGWTWMDNWLEACGAGCNPDFIPVHWYGNFEGMMSHVGRVTDKWPDKEVWVTEYGYPHQELGESKKFWNMSARSFDSWPNVTRYSYFGAFRSSVSNVGPSAAMLTQDGKLTDIGSWYMGGEATNNIPKGSRRQLYDLVALLIPWFVATIIAFVCVLKSCFWLRGD